MSVTVTQIVTELRTILSALPDVDYASQDNYEPAIKSRKIALLIVPFEQRGSLSYGAIGGSIGTYSIAHSHRITCEFWIKVNTGHIDEAMQRGRDICLEAMLLLSANPTLNGMVTQLGASSIRGNSAFGGLLAEYEILGHIDRANVPFVVGKVYVPVTVNEAATW